VHIGDIVKIAEGPLAGRLARFAGAEGRRVLVEVELQGRQFEVEIDLDWIVATSAERKSVAAVDARGTTRRRKPLA
jgi:hypothetical protein